MTIRIAMWSGPRNISTAMMRSFGARSDCAVSDEPYYGAFLRQSGEPHPMAREIIEDMDCDWVSILETLAGAPKTGEPVWYQKHMPHHMVGAVGIEDMPGHRHAFLIRAPERVVASYRAKNELRRPEVLGFADIRRYVAFETKRSGVIPPIVDADKFMADPTAMLEKLCARLGIGWTTEMLSWENGPHPDDGVWGEHWYEKVNDSTGFGSPPGPIPKLDGDYAKTANACRDDYEALLDLAL